MGLRRLFLSPVFATSRERSSPEVGLVAEVMAFGITRLLKHSHPPLSTKMTKQTQVTRRKEKYFMEKTFKIIDGVKNLSHNYTQFDIYYKTTNKNH